MMISANYSGFCVSLRATQTLTWLGTWLSGAKNFGMDHDSMVAPLSGFGPGAIVMTSYGEMPVEWLEKGDKVIPAITVCSLSSR